MVKVNVDAIKQRLKEQEEKKSSSRSDRPSIMLKAKKAGKLSFRAVPYPHNNSQGEPFCERFYHFGINGRETVYCPKKNKGQECHLCNFVWERVVSNKGNTPAVKQWADKLPKLNVYVPGIVRGEEAEGCKFFRCGSQEKQRSANHQKLYDWFFDESTQDWMNATKGENGGFDMILDYEELDEARSKALNNAKLALKKGGMELDRKSTPFSKDKEEFEKFLATVPNIDEVLYQVKTTEDTLEILKKWCNSTPSEKEANVKSDETPSELTETETSDLDKKLAEALGD